GISLARPLQASQSVDYTPIYSLFCENPSLYASSLPMIKRSKIQFLHQCTTSDNFILLLYQNAFSCNSTERRALSLLNGINILSTRSLIIVLLESQMTSFQLNKLS